MKKEGKLLDFLPTVPFKSEIITSEQYAFIWMFLDEVKRLRVPKIKFRASRDGYNLDNLYENAKPYTGSYKNSIILIKTKNGQIFGVFLDTVPEKHENKFIGGYESFVFQLEPCVDKFTAEDNFVAMFEQDYFAIGAGGDGPAIRLDTMLKIGRTYESKTFQNNSLTKGKGQAKS